MSPGISQRAVWHHAVNHRDKVYAEKTYLNTNSDPFKAADTRTWCGPLQASDEQWKGFKNFFTDAKLIFWGLVDQ